MESPITKIRRERDLTRAELALLLNAPYSQICQLEKGDVRATTRVREGLAAVGEDIPAFLAALEAFRAERRKVIAKKVAHRSAAFSKRDAKASAANGAAISAKGTE